MKVEQKLQLVNGAGELPLARKSILLEDSRQLVFLGEPESSSWIALKGGEALISTRLSLETAAWLSARLGIAIPELEGLQEPFAAVINAADAKINILQANPAPSARRDLLLALEGSTILEEGENGRKPDTQIILGQKAQAKAKLAPLVREAIAGGQAISIGTVDGNNIFILPTTKTMLEAITIEGDPQSENRKLQKAGALVDPGTILVVQQNADASFTYLSTSVGKASGTDMPKLPVQLTAEGESALTLAKAIEAVCPTSLTATRLRAHLLRKLLADATAIIPEGTLFESPQAFDINRARKEVLAGLPENFANYLEQWAIATLPQIQEEMSSKKTTDGNVLVSELGELSEPIIEWVLNASGQEGDTQFDRLVTEVLSRRTLMERERAIKAAGMTFLDDAYQANGTTLELAFEANFLRYLDFLRTLSEEAQQAYLATLPEDIQANIAAITAKGKKKLTEQDIAQVIASGELDAQIRETGIQNFTPERARVKAEGEKRPDINRQGVVRRAERSRQRRELLIDGGDYEQALQNALAIFDRYANGARSIYRTDHVAALDKALAEIDYPPYAREAARIPWRMVEGPMYLEGRETFERFGRAWGLASGVARDLYIGTAYVMEKYGIAKNDPLAQQITVLAGMVRETADWKMPDFLPRPTVEQPGLPIPVMLLRPDFAREKMPDGSIRWIATEGEASPGGLGFDVIIGAAHADSEVRSNTLERFYEFLQLAEIPAGVNRNQITIVMTEEWDAYRTELTVFQNAMREQYPTLNISLVSIEELAKDTQKGIASGFVFHFAYPWNFIKDPTTANDMQKEMANRAQALYRRQGKDVFIFNDPFAGRILHGKMDIAIYHMPDFAAVFGELLQRSGIQTNEATQMATLLQEMSALSIPVVQNTKSKALNAYAAKAIKQALKQPDQWILKLGMDPNGAEDWGARGIIVGAEETPEKWAEALQQAITGNLPYVLQRVVTNVPFNQPRSKRVAGPLNANGTQQIAMYSRDPNDRILGIGDLALIPSVKPRLNLFIFNTDNDTTVTQGTMTLSPASSGFDAVHGKSDSGETIVAMLGEDDEIPGEEVAA